MNDMIQSAPNINVSYNVYSSTVSPLTILIFVCQEVAKRYITYKTAEEGDGVEDYADNGEEMLKDDLYQQQVSTTFS